MKNLDGVKVEIGASGALGSIMLNGIDLSKAVSSITYRHNAGELPTLELSIADVDIVDIKSVVGSVLLMGGVAASGDDTVTPEGQ